MGTQEHLEVAKPETFIEGPALAPPDGILPSFDNPPNDNDLTIAVIASCVVMVIIFCSIRGYTRIFCLKKARLEDCKSMILPFWMFYIGGTWILATMLKDPGLFIHQWNIRVKDLEKFIYPYILASILYCFNLMFIKVSILLEWAHIFVPRSSRNAFFWTCYGMIWAKSSLVIATITTINCACSPRERIWRRWIPGTCINITAFNVFVASFKLGFDILILLLPHRVIWVSVIFSIGVVACVSAGGRLASAINMNDSRDTTFVYSKHLLLGLAETTSAQLVFCIPAVPIAFRDHNLISRLSVLLRSKTGTLLSPQTLSQKSTQRHSWYQKSPRGGRVDEYSRMDENSEVNLTELGSVKTRSGHMRSQLQENHGHNYGGILRTTEIQITTRQEPNLVIPNLQREEHLHPWLEGRPA
ncbi:hypothetical protein F5X99DRAFT_417450 [Biscogniauxia marginata]|nr:hypothetical protein F5X99DRAFT_417450 [Biscogniauxia marginata]